MVGISESIKIGETVTAEVTRDPQVLLFIEKIIIFIALIFIFQHFLQKIIENPKDKRRKYYISYFIICLLIPLVLYSIGFFDLVFLWSITFVLSFLALIKILIKILEIFSDKKEKTRKYLIHYLLILLFLIIWIIGMLKTAMHYPSPDLLRPIRDILGIIGIS